MTVFFICFWLYCQAVFGLARRPRKGWEAATGIGGGVPRAAVHSEEMAGCPRGPIALDDPTLVPRIDEVDLEDVGCGLIPNIINGYKLTLAVIMKFLPAPEIPEL